MKIIFDSEEEKARFFDEMNDMDGACPYHMGLIDSCGRKCSECWDDTIVDCEIKESED